MILFETNEAVPSLSNEQVAVYLEEVAELLDAQEANPYRVRAYGNAASTLRQLDRPVRGLLEEGGPAALRRMPAIGVSLARSIEELVTTGRLGLLDRLRGETGTSILF